MARLELTAATHASDTVSITIDAPRATPLRNRHEGLLLASRFLGRAELLALAQTSAEFHQLLTQSERGARVVLLASRQLQQERQDVQAKVQATRDDDTLEGARNLNSLELTFCVTCCTVSTGVASLCGWLASDTDDDFQIVITVVAVTGALTSLVSACGIALNCMARRALANPDMDAALARYQHSGEAFDTALRKWLGVPADGRLTLEMMQRWLASPPAPPALPADAPGADA